MDELGGSRVASSSFRALLFARARTLARAVGRGRRASEKVKDGTEKGPLPVADLRDGEGARERGGTRSTHVENEQPRSAEAQAPVLGDLGEPMFSS